MRTEFGAERTNCDCETCIDNCKVMPGFLIPSDLGRLIPKDADPFKWAESNLNASPGATVMRRGEIFNILTLVPQTKSDGSCIYLGKQTNRCAVHDDAPFGCAFFDCTMKANTPLAQDGLLAIERDFINRGLYFQLWVHLAFLGKTSRGPAVLRQKLVGISQ